MLDRFVGSQGHAMRRVIGACVIGAAILLHTGCGGVSNRLQARLDLKKGNQSYLAGNFREAIGHYNHAVERVPTLTRAHLYRAYSHEAIFRASESLDERRVQADSAAASFLRYTELIESGHQAGDDAPGRERIDEHILTLYLDSLQPHKASELLESRLASHPNDMATLQMLANLAIEQGNYDGAIRWHRKRIELAPDEPGGHVALAVMAWNFSNNNMVADSVRTQLLDEGVTSAERAIELRPDYFEALVYANLLYREKAKYAESAELRAEYEKKYADYQERARRVGEQQKKKDGVNASSEVKHGKPGIRAG
jgi:tetratricopeptide (TPR) repeat protein